MSFRLTDSAALSILPAVLFDQFRGSLLRYPSLFQHLRTGKSRDNIRGWLFRVVHNPALRRRGDVRQDSEMWAVSLSAVSLPLARFLSRLARCAKRCRL
jgi:hypothetical protein